MVRVDRCLEILSNFVLLKICIALCIEFDDDNERNTKRLLDVNLKTCNTRCHENVFIPYANQTLFFNGYLSYYTAQNI